MIDIAILKSQANGRWLEILANIGGLQSEFLHFDNREGPCPRCGGNTRFRGLDEETGALFCSHCFNKKNGDGISALEWLTGKSFSEALDMLAEYLDAKPTEQGHALNWDSVIGLGSANAVAVDGKPASETFATLGDAIAALERRHGPRSATWTYCDAKGEPVGVVVRWNLSDGRKDIRPVSRFSDGWRLAGMPTPRPLYGLPDLAGANRVYVCEGEKAAEAVRSLGLVATTSPHGCNSASKADWRPLAGKEAVILPDADLPGRKYTDAVTALLAKLTPVPVVKVVELPGLPEHGDAADFVAANAGTNADELRRIVETLADGTARKEGGAKAERFPLISCRALDSEDYTPSPIITEALFAGSPAVIGGMFKTGKTLLGIDAAISVATGRPFLSSWTVPEPREVVYFTGEGGPAVAQEYGRRIASSKGIALADVTQLHWAFSVPRLEDLRDLDAFAKVLDDTAAEVAVLDNLMLCLSGDNAGNVYSMGGTLGNAVRICLERNVTPIFVHHFKRTRATADPFAPGELIDLTQAGVAEIAGQWLLLTRRRAFNPDEAGEHELWLSIGGRMGHSSLHALNVHEGSRANPGGRRWEVDVLSPDDVTQQVSDRKEEKRRAKAGADLETDRREIVGVVVKLTAPESKTAIRERCQCGHARFGRAFASLIADGTLERAEVTKTNGQTYDGWKVRQ